MILTTLLLRRLSIPLLAMPLAAQDPLPFQEMVNRTGATSQLILCHRSEDPSPEDDFILRLRAERQLVTDALPQELAQKVWKERGWDTQPHWILLNQEGREVAHGLGQPTGEAIRKQMEDRGIQPRWETRAEFLKKRPLQGEAWLEEVNRGITLATYRVKVLRRQGKAARGPRTKIGCVEIPTTRLLEPDPVLRGAQADHIFCELAQGLDGIAKVPEWHGRADELNALLVLLAGGDQSPRIRRTFALLLKELQSALRRDPMHVSFNSWHALSCIADVRLDVIPDDIMLPGRQPWPNAWLLSEMVASFLSRSDWEGALAFLQVSDPKNQHPPTDPDEWGLFRYAQAVRELSRAYALYKLNRMPEAERAILEAHRWAGAIWDKDFTAGFGAFKDEDPELPEALRKALKAPPLPDPEAPPAIPPLRLVIRKIRAGDKEWQALRMDEAFLPWSPAELTWTSSSTKGEVPLWELFRGDASLASGNSLPTPRAMADMLKSQGTPKLQRLDEILEALPNHIGAHEARFALLKPRMPEPRLEARLAEDAMKSLKIGSYWPCLLDFGPEAAWKPDPALWQWSSQQVLPRIEEKLRHWPTDSGTWRWWIAWSGFHPDKPSPTQLLRDLPRWPESAPLNLEVHKAMAARLRQESSFLEMRAWFSEAWACMDKSPRKPEDHAASREAIVEPLMEAMKALGDCAGARQIEEEYRRTKRP